MNKKNISVCYVGFMHRADDQRFVHKQCAALVRAGYDVTYFSIAKREEVVNGVKIRPISGLDRLWTRAFMSVRILPKLLRENCQVYHLLDPELLFAGFVLKLFFRRRVLFDAHEDYVEYIGNSPYLKWPFNRICSWLCKGLLTLSSCVFDGFVFGDDNLFEKDFPWIGSRKICFHHFPLLSMFPANPVPFADRKYDVVHSGGLSEDKGVFDILEAVHLLRGRYDNLRVLFIGEPVKYVRKRFYEYMEKYELESCVEITGRLPYAQVSELLNESKVGLIPLHDILKYQKQSATKQFEYMAKNVPIVSTDLAPARKYMTHGVHGYLVKPKDPQSMADAIYDIITNPELGEKMAKACRENVIDNQLYAEKDCEKLLDFYDYIISNPRLGKSVK